MSPVVLVAGPPCGGKTTYVQAHAQPGDEVVDFDAIMDRDASPLTRENAAQEWRRRVDAPLEGTRWVIWTAPRRTDRGRFRAMHQAEVVVVWTPQALCLARSRVSRPPTWALYYIPAWFQMWEPSRSGAERVVMGYDTASKPVGAVS